MMFRYFRNKLYFLIPSISDVLFTSIFVYLSIIGGNGLLSDCDTGYHIRAGEEIIKKLSVPTHDIFSFHNPPPEWIAHEWLSEVIMAIIHRFSGLTGLVLFFAISISILYLLFFEFIKREGINVIVSLSVCMLVIASSTLHWLARPHIFSLMITIIWYHLLDQFQYNGRNYIYFLPLIMFIWVNLHGGFILGLILIIVYIAGNLMMLLLSDTMQRMILMRKVRMLLITFSACVVSTYLNPYGFKILIFPLRLVMDRFIMDHVNEFLSPNFHEAMPFKYLLFLLIGISSLSPIKLNVIELLLVLLFTDMALYSARYIPLFSIIVAPVLLRRLKTWPSESRSKMLEELKIRIERIERIDKSSKGHLLPILSVVLICILGVNGSIKFEFDRNRKPVDAVEFLKKADLMGNMFNNDEFGDYIIYAAWPKYRVFFDGRSDMYGSDRMKEYFKVARIEPGWEEVLNKYKINFIVFDASSSLSLFLMQRNEWKLIYADRVANIFVRDVPENGHIIDQYGDAKLNLLEKKIGR